MKAKKYILLFIGISFLHIASFGQTKDEIIKNFKNEIRAYCDSADIYFEYGISEAQKGTDPKEISKAIKSKLVYYQRKIDERSKKFLLEANELEMTMEEYEKVYAELKVITNPMIEKYAVLKEFGIELE